MWTVCAGVDTMLSIFGGLVCVPARAPLRAASSRFWQLLPPRRLSAQSDSGKRRRHRQAGGRNVGLERRDQAQEFVVEEVGARRPGPADHAGARQSRRAHGACCAGSAIPVFRCVRAPACHAIAHQSMYTQLDIPWKNLRSRPVVVTITGLYVVVCPQHEPARSAEEQQARALAAKRAAIAELDAQGPDGVRTLAR